MADGLIVPNIRKRIGLLIVAHVILGMLFGLVIRAPSRDVGSVIFIAVVFADAGLFAISAALAVASWPRRLIAAGAGLVYLWALVAVVTRHETWIFILIILATFSTVYLVAMAIRYRGVQLRRFATGDAVPVPEGLQFTIRHLMVLTAVVATLLAILKNVHSLGENNGGVLVVIYGLCFIVCPLVALWASLGLGRVMVRAPIALCLAAAPGFLPTFYFARPMPLWFWPSITFTQGAITMASLLVVRSCGYRLVRGAGKQAADPGDIKSVVTSVAAAMPDSN